MNNWPADNWNDHDTTRLRALWKTNHTGAEIARLLGKTRNAVMGKLKRIKLLGTRKTTMSEQVKRGLRAA